MRDVDSSARKRKLATAATDGRPRPQRPTQAPSAPDDSARPRARLREVMAAPLVPPVPRGRGAAEGPTPRTRFHQGPSSGGRSGKPHLPLE